MTPDNLLKADVPTGDLTHNFNYQKYLASNGWAGRARRARQSAGVCLGEDLGGTDQRPARPISSTPQSPIATGDKSRPRCAPTPRRSAGDSSLTSNGVWPLVDFQSVGLYGGNQDDDGELEAEYVPVVAGSTTSAAHLDGTRILQRPFRNLKARSEALAPGVPVVLFIDWPTNFMSY